MGTARRAVEHQDSGWLYRYGLAASSIWGLGERHCRHRHRLLVADPWCWGGVGLAAEVRGDEADEKEEQYPKRGAAN